MLYLMRHCETSVKRVSRGTVGTLTIVGVIAAVGVLAYAGVIVVLVGLPIACVYWFVQGVRDRPRELTRDDLRSDAERAAWDRAHAAARSQAAISNRR